MKDLLKTLKQMEDYTDDLIARYDDIIHHTAYTYFIYGLVTGVAISAFCCLLLLGII